MSRNRVSTSEKALRGTLRDDRLLLQRVARLAELPAAPAALSKHARAAWERFGGQALSLGTLTDFDLGLLELLARTWASTVELEDVLRRDGPIITSGEVRKAHPALQALDRARALAHRLLGDLGLTPPGRERVSLPAPVSAGNEFDEF